MKQYKVRRHSPVYYVVLLVLVGVGIFAYFKVKQIIDQNQKRLEAIWTNLQDPFAAGNDFGADDPRGILERFLKCWKQGNEKSDLTGDYTGFECMLLYVSPEELKDYDGLGAAVKSFKEKFGAMELKSHGTIQLVSQKSATSWELRVSLDTLQTGGVLQKKGDLNITAVFEKNEPMSRGKYIREHGQAPGPDDPPIEAKETWGLLIRKAIPTWEA